MQREQEQELRPTIPATITRLPLPESHHENQRTNNLFQLVATPKITDSENELDPHQIAQLAKLLKEAKTGKLKGFGFLADYGNGYAFGLEGSYLENPESAIVPLKRLDRRIMDQVEEL